MNYIKGIIWLILSLIIGSTNDAIMKYLGTVSITPWQITFFRYLSATVCILPFLFLKNNFKLKTNTPLLHIIRGSILMLAMILWNHGLTLVPLSTATLLSFTVPIFVLALAPFFLKEKTHWQIWIATFACFTGAIIATNSLNMSFQSASIILITSELLFATLDILYKKYLSKDSMLTTVFYSSLIPTILTSIPALLNPISLSTNHIFLLIALGLGSNLLLFCILMAYSCTTATSLAPFRYVELIISIGLGYLIFSEIPNAHMILGAIIILGTTFLISFFIKK